MKTEKKILSFLVANPGRKLTIRALSQAVRTDYKIVHTAVRNLVDGGVLARRQVGRASEIGLAPAPSGPLLEALNSRRDALLARDGALRLVLESVEKGVGTPFFILLLFGSRASGKEKGGSDYDLVFVFPDGCAALEKRVSRELGLLPLDMHPLFYSESSFLAALGQNTGNAASEAVNSGAVLHGAESFLALRKRWMTKD